MFRCIQCNKFSLFLNWENLCKNCEIEKEKAEEEKRRIAKEEAQKRLKEKELEEKNFAINYLESIQEKTSKLPSCFDSIGKGSIFDDFSIDKILPIPNICEELLNLLLNYKDYPKLYDIFINTVVTEMNSVFSYKKSPYFPQEIIHLYEKNITEKDVDKFFEDYIKKIQKTIENSKNVIDFSNKFEKSLLSIPKVEVKINKSNVLERIRLEDFQVPTISNVTKSSSMSLLQDYIVIDVETTGLRPTTDEIVQLSAVRFEDFEPVEAFVSYVRPKKKISAEARSVNHISDEVLENAPRLFEVSDAFSSFIGKALPLVGHNIIFDLKFLGCSGISLGNKSRKKYDTLSLSKKMYESYKYSLDYLCCTQLKIHRSSSHNAFSDAVATGLLFKDICKSIL